MDLGVVLGILFGVLVLAVFIGVWYRRKRSVQKPTQVIVYLSSRAPAKPGTKQWVQDCVDYIRLNPDEHTCDNMYGQIELDETDQSSTPNLSASGTTSAGSSSPITLDFEKMVDKRYRNVLINACVAYLSKYTGHTLQEAVDYTIENNKIGLQVAGFNVDSSFAAAFKKYMETVSVF
jgi:hypothetical protein